MSGHDHARLVVRGLHKTLVGVNGEERKVLLDLTFEVKPGGLVAVVGPSGAGKTTLLRSISGLLAPDVGEVRYGGSSSARCRAGCRSCSRTTARACSPG